MAPWGWGGPWGPMPWGGVASPEARVIQKIIAVLKENAGVTKYTGSGDGARIYAGYPATIQDAVFPAVGIEIIESPGRMTNPASLDEINIAITVYMRAVGANAEVWDDVFDCLEAIIDELHHSDNSLFDTTIGVRILNMVCTGQGGQQMADDIMVLPSRWSVMAQIRGIS